MSIAMRGLLEQMDAAQLARARQMMSHGPSRALTSNQVGRRVADGLQAAGLLTAPVPVLGDAVGLLGDAAMYAAKPEERTWGNAALTALGALPFVPSAAGAASKAAKGLDMSNAARDERMAQQGYTRGFFRGGGGVADGPHYTPDPAAAKDFSLRHGDRADVREYALRLGKTFDVNKDFGEDDLKRLAEVLGKDFKNKMAAKELPLMAGDFRSGRMPGKMLYQVLEVQSGGNAMDVLRSAGFNSVYDHGQEVKMLSMGNVRDPAKAAFNPSQLGRFGPFLGVAGVGLLGGGLLGANENEDSVR